MLRASDKKVCRNGSEVNGWQGTLLAYKDRVIYLRGLSGAWYRQSNGVSGSWITASDPTTGSPPPAPTPAPAPAPPPPAPGESASGTTIPSATQIVDYTGAVWTLRASDKKVCRNGSEVNGWQGTLLAYKDRVIYLRGLSGAWYRQSNGVSGSWITASDPTTGSPPPAPTPAPSPSPSVSYGLEWPGNGAVRRMLYWHNPFPIYDATYIFRVFPRKKTVPANPNGVLHDVLLGQRRHVHLGTTAMPTPTTARIPIRSRTERTRAVGDLRQQQRLRHRQRSVGIAGTRRRFGPGASRHRSPITSSTGTCPIPAK